MISVDMKPLIKRMNQCCRTALEESAGICVSKGHKDVSIEHLLIALSKQAGNDFRIIFQTANKDPDHFRERVEACFTRFPMVENGRAPAFSAQLFELIQDAWLIASVELEDSSLRSGAILLALIKGAGQYARFEYFKEIEGFHPDALLSKFHTIVDGSIETVVDVGGKAKLANDVVQEESMLAKFAQNFTELARAGKIDPVFCRDSEIRQITEILCRRRKNNPICVGEAGVGKTAVAEGLALRIVQGDVPETLKGVDLWALDIGALQAGAAVKGEFEKRLKGVIEEVRSKSSEIILFIDEAHTLIGAGGNQGGSDAANLLKPALARGELRTIAATTWSEYKKYFEKDPALSRRFQPVALDEPDIDQAAIILRGLAASYEKAHGVYITDAALDAAARLSARYITGRQLPDKAIDVLDTACARVRASAATDPTRLEELNKELLALERERSSLERDSNLGLSSEESNERMTALDARLEAIESEKIPLLASFEQQKQLAKEFDERRDDLLQRTQDKDSEETDLTEVTTDLLRIRNELSEVTEGRALISVEVGHEEIASVIADWTGIPVTSMVEDELAKLLDLKSRMGELIKGQDHALALIEERLQTARLDLHRQEQPIGVFLLAGSSGVGKTETARETARQLFGSEQFMTTVNMSEYQEQHTISRLIGSPPGYVGFGEGGVLTEAIRKKPYSVVLLDEVEKADVNVLNLFYQAFDKGELADGEGRLIDCKNIVFFLTTNLGSDQIEQWYEEAEQAWQAQIDALKENTEDNQTTPIFTPPSSELMTRSLQPVFANHFKPALLARMLPIVYKPLSDEVMADIVDGRLADLGRRLKQFQNVDLVVEDTAATRIKALCGRGANGARLIDQTIHSKILPPISQEILQAGIRDEMVGKVIVSSEDQVGFVFEFRTRERKKM